MIVFYRQLNRAQGSLSHATLCIEEKRNPLLSTALKRKVEKVMTS